MRKGQLEIKRESDCLRAIIIDREEGYIGQNEYCRRMEALDRYKENKLFLGTMNNRFSVN